MPVETGGPAPRFPWPPGPFGGEPREFAQRREQCPFGRVSLRSGHEAILALDYADIAAAIGDTRLSRNALTKPGAPRWTKASNIFTDPISLVNQDGPDHMRQRQTLAASLTPARVRAWRPLIAETTGRLLDSVEAGGRPGELMEGYFKPLPIRIICRLLGVPLADQDTFCGWSNAFMSTVVVTEDEREQAIREFMDYTRGLVEEQRARPTDNLMGQLVSACYVDGKLSDEELFYVLVGVIAAGTDTITNVLSRITLTLLRDDRAKWQQVADAGGVSTAVLEELLRFVQQGNGAMLRVALEDVELPSGTVRAGETLALPLSAAGLDPKAYPDPHQLHFDRVSPPRTLMFGGGAHYCVGIHLAKAQLQIGLQSLMERFPALDLAVDPRQLRFSKGELLTTIKAFPAVW
ncbi:cytochrome P450 [Actinacidiphila sp. ITFR-21]|uniref:cytochrome P450 n=1 Tax=Actinacidiphila sp. ITFR-21 TaxID=3075199 RepID=UPI002889902D|nr:cytochrome P450 [Streptomyces sp. ITFR-21]WNI18947.1 cytochrome P450 [Streptomyces sp. ITFR-21]